jgi:formylglycine-generating enzyme required for sulfatase activity
MKHLRFNFYASVAILILASLACSQFSAPLATAVPPTAAPTQAPAEPSATATLVTVQTEAPVTPTLVTVDLSGPPMEVGSIYPYVDGSLLVAVPGGPFTMGHGGSDNPEHQVTLSDFWIYQAKVTNQQYALCVNSGKCKAPDNIDNIGYGDALHANDPVTGVNWDQANSYCEFVHGALPTEAQWEKTARGPNGNIYPWGDHSPSCDYLNYNNCVGKTTDVTKYPQGQSYYHALDMEGNAFEWVNDWYSALYYKSGPPTDPFGPDSGQQRSVRSTGYKSKDDQTPASTRFFDFPKDHRRDLGFRCVVKDPTYFAPYCQMLGLFDGGPTGTAGGGQLSTDCPNLGMGLTSFCKAGIVRVTITDDHSPDPNAVLSGLGSCNPVGAVTPGVFPQTYDCGSYTTAGIQSICTYTSSGSVQCSAHYTLNTGTGMCVWDGTGSLGTQCLPGYNYDPATQCCSVAPATSTSYPACPLGTTLGFVPPGNPVCVPNGSALNQPSHFEPIQPPNPATCTGGGNPGGTGTPAACTLTVDACRNIIKCTSGIYYVDSKSCTCQCGS